MKRIVAGLALAAVLGTLGFWAYTYFFPSPEKVIRKQLSELARSASFDGNEGSLARLANAQRITGFFTADADIRFEAPGRGHQSISGREDLLQAVMAVKAALSSLKIDFPDVQVLVNPGKTTAVADVTVRGIIGGERDPYIQEMNFHMEKVDGQWLVRRIEPVKTLLRLKSGQPDPELRRRV